MAETILFSNVDKILGTLASHAIQEIFLAWGLEDDLRRLKATMSSIKAVMLDAEEQQATNNSITLWLKRLKHVVYDVEDVLDDFEYQLLRKQIVKTNGGINRKVHHFFSSSNPIAYRLRIGHRIKDLKLRLDEIAADKDQFNLAHRLDAGPVQLREREMTHSFINSSNIIGREGDRETVVEFLLDSHQGHADNDIVSVIPIVGIGGLGKTALAKMVFNDPRVVGHFHSKLWVCLGDMKEFNVNQVMAKIAKEMGGSVDSSPQQFLEVIQERLLGKMFLLVLDDVWEVNGDSWLEFKSLLAIGCQGSKIVVTTRDSLVASSVCPVATHNLQGLPHKECVSLFKKLAFASEAEVDEKLMKIGEDIVKKCNGVPLAVRTLGSLMSSKSYENEWLSVRDSRMWQIQESQKSILSVLKFSYDHLPSHLKQCFIYCSIFPEDHQFSSTNIISYWMAHGLLQSPKQNQELEDVGKQYIKELLSRGFFQDFEEGIPIFGWFFKMHDLVRELACSLGQEEFGIDSDTNKNTAENVRHVWFDRQEFLINSGDGIRTLFTRSSNYLLRKSCISKFKYLRFLHLRYSSLEELPNSIGTLKHLRSLDLSGCMALKRLPDSICKLHNLQTLNIIACGSLERLPKGIGELINLRDFRITTQERYLPKNNGIGHLRSLQSLIFGSCPNLQILFEKKENLLQPLRSLTVWDCSSLVSLFSSSGSASLTTLEVLDISDCPKLNLNYKFRESNEGVEPWLHLPRLRSLSLASLPQLIDLPEWIQGCAATLEFLGIYECENLKALPEWLPNLTTLKNLEIVGCDLLTERCEKEIGEDWPKIAHVPNTRIS